MRRQADVGAIVLTEHERRAFNNFLANPTATSMQLTFDIGLNPMESVVPKLTTVIAQEFPGIQIQNYRPTQYNNECYVVIEFKKRSPGETFGNPLAWVGALFSQPPSDPVPAPPRLPPPASYSRGYGGAAAPAAPPRAMPTPPTRLRNYPEDTRLQRICSAITDALQNTTTSSARDGYKRVEITDKRSLCVFRHLSLTHDDADKILQYFNTQQTGQPTTYLFSVQIKPDQSVTFYVEPRLEKCAPSAPPADVTPGCATPPVRFVPGNPTPSLDKAEFLKKLGQAYWNRNKTAFDSLVKGGISSGILDEALSPLLETARSVLGLDSTSSQKLLHWSNFVTAFNTEGSSRPKPS